MEREPVASTNIISVGYDAATETLEVEFASSAIYQYYNVGPAVFEQLMLSPSKGQFLNLNIKNAFAFSRVG